MSTPTEDLSAAGVSIWLDDLSRSRIDSGNLAELIGSRNVVGVTTNPTIFANALAKGDDYDEQVTLIGTKEDAETAFRVFHQIRMNLEKNKE